MSRDKITLQQIFDAAWQAFIVEEKPPSMLSTSPDSGCAYRGQGGARCAVGLCLPDRTAQVSENKVFSQIVRRYPMLFSVDLQHRTDYELDEFQARLHDRMQEGGQWLVDVAKRS